MGRRQQIPGKLLDWGAMAFALLLGCGIGLHLLLRDAADPLAPLYYALPLPIIFSGWIALAAWCRYRKKKDWAAAAVLMAFLVGGAWWKVSLSWYGENWVDAEIAQDLSVAFWNAAHNDQPATALVEWIDANEVDLVALVEVGAVSDELRERCRKLLPDHSVRKLPHGMTVIYRGKIDKEVTTIAMPNRSFANLVKLRLDDDALPLRLIVADVGPNPFYPRDQALDEVLSLSASGESRTLIVGDFNTPFQSCWFEAYHRNFNHAWEDAGKGYFETWPWFAPVLCLDHIWLSPDMRAVSAERKNFWSSDHSLIFVRATLEALDS